MPDILKGKDPINKGNDTEYDYSYVHLLNLQDRKGKMNIQEPILILVLDGTLNVHSKDCSRYAHENEMMLLEKKKSYEYSYVPDKSTHIFTALVIHISKDFMNAFPVNYQISKLRKVEPLNKYYGLPIAQQMRGLASEIKEMLCNKDWDRQLFHNSVQNFMIYLYRFVTPLFNALYYLTKHELPNIYQVLKRYFRLSLKEIYQILHTSHKCLNRWTMKYCNMTVGQLKNEILLSEIMDQLVNTDTPITVLLQEYGKSYSQITRLFIKKTGMTPTEYRNAHRIY